ncbi:hypothetical protein [Streptomyces sp. AB3(2024)]|uniref:hypothetical protein n=1 Tax=Streptomyces sp. AB3(2024) TaxID=3317321 RepID=UPI0035A3B464
MRAALFINGGDAGVLAVQAMYDNVKAGRTMPAEAFAPHRRDRPRQLEELRARLWLSV